VFIYINIDEMARISVFLAFVDVAFQFAHAQVGFRHQGYTRATLGGSQWSRRLGSF
jgi:hypothetical protein